jgi:dihydrofolate reductase
MRKVVLAMFVSLDGFIEGANKQLVPPAYSADLDRMWIKDNIEGAGVLMYGRVCYAGMVAYWTSPAANPAVAGQLASLPKIVFSRTLAKADWNHTTIVRDNIADEIGTLKRQPGKDLVLIGGAGIAATFMTLGVIDEYRLLISPIVLGAGTPLFRGGYDRFNLKLVDAKPLDTGAILLRYHTEGKK